MPMMVAELFNDTGNIDMMVAKCQQAYANVSDTTIFAMSMSCSSLNSLWASNDSTKFFKWQLV